jgi:site-specific DNA-methyltransferase (adenine-specific)
LKYGTGALNIDGSRIGISTDDPNHRKPSVPFTGRVFAVADGKSNGRPVENLNSKGRWPANILFDEAAAEMLDAQSGNCKSAGKYKDQTLEKEIGLNSVFGVGDRRPTAYAGETGGASRFFYVAKASKRERGEGNGHPTVKPTKLMEYLIKLVTPPHGTVLDPFMGSGSTGVAAKNLNFKFVGMEMSEEYFEIAKKRVEAKS